MFWKETMVDKDSALVGREQSIITCGKHFVLESEIMAEYPDSSEIHLALGCFWGAERVFWEIPGVITTAVGYAGGFTQNPTYKEVCSGKTGHTESVRVVFDPAKVTLGTILKKFWESHDPTQGFRQGNDRGTQYRSAIYYMDSSQRQIIETSLQQYQPKLRDAGFPEITTEIKPAASFFYAEDEHQQYLAKNPNGYCGLGGTGVACSTRPE